MKTIEILTPDVANIVIAGPTQCGKSIVLEEIARVLKEKFGATVLNTDSERNGHEDVDSLSEWQKRMVKGTVWIIHESNCRRGVSGA